MDMVHIDLLLDILRRLPPRSLAVSRCACTAWRAAIDHHRLLRADLLPLSVDAAVYDERSSEEPARLFGRPSTARHITSNLDYLADSGVDVHGVQDHCNGLFLTHGWNDELRVKVVNIATRQWAPLPLLPCACSWPPAMCGRCRNNRYLAYDPTISPHYKVLYIPRILADTTCAEWPPTPYVILDPDEHMHYAAYWQGSLYVPSPRIKDDFLLRINLSSDKYQLIKLPKGRTGF
ncbi:uncharacterized protein [Aegilops tauschii subsp. strangulata]|uniref:uncharacterized protein n=1 Tax=Aegilops tauschii subsp. strangulata TaxID=200361 RepID=UPI003CC899F8